LQRFVAQNTLHNTSLLNQKSLVHAYFTATPGSTYTIWKAAVALPPADFDSRRGG